MRKEVTVLMCDVCRKEVDAFYKPYPASTFRMTLIEDGEYFRNTHSYKELCKDCHGWVKDKVRGILDEIGARK